MVHPEYAAIFAALRQCGVRHCLLRDEIDEGRLVDDLDLLVESSRFEEAISILWGLGYRLRVTEKRLPLKSVLVAFRNGRFLVIDLHRTIVQNGIVLLDGDSVLSRLPGEQILPGATDLLLILVLHNVIGKSQIQEKHVDTIKRCLRQTDDRGVREALGDSELADIVLDVLENLDVLRHDEGQIQKIRERLLNVYRRCDPGYPQRQRQARIQDLRRRLSFRTRAPLYALTGVDGAGKSSLATALHRILNQPGGIRAEEIYMGPWGHYRLRFMSGELFVPGWSVDRREWWRGMFSTPSEGRPSMADSIKLITKLIFSRPMTKQERDCYRTFRRTSRLFLTVRYIRSVLSATRFLTLLILEMYYRYFLAYRLRRRGVVVLADRYIYDLMTGRMHEIIPQYRRVRSLLCRIFPRPTAVFLLQNDPETIMARKNDLEPEMLVRHMELYEVLADQYGFAKIHTDRKPTELAVSIIQERFGEIVAHMRT